MPLSDGGTKWLPLHLDPIAGLRSPRAAVSQSTDLSIVQWIFRSARELGDHSTGGHSPSEPGSALVPTRFIRQRIVITVSPQVDGDTSSRLPEYPDLRKADASRTFRQRNVKDPLLLPQIESCCPPYRYGHCGRIPRIGHRKSGRSFKLADTYGPGLSSRPSSSACILPIPSGPDPILEHGG